MDMNRRDFFSNMGKKTAAIAAGAAAPALLHLNSLSDEMKALSKDLNGKLGAISAEVREQVQSLHNRLNGAALAMSYQQMQLCVTSSCGNVNAVASGLRNCKWQNFSKWVVTPTKAASKG